MGKTLLIMQMSVAIMVLDGKQIMKEGNKANTFMCKELGSSI